MSDAEIYEFDLNGYIVYPGALSADQVTACNRIIDGFVADDNAFNFDFFHRDPLFFEIMARPHTLEVLRTMIGDWFRLDHVYGVQMHKDGPDNTNLHGGPRTAQGEHCYQWLQGRMYNGLVVVTYALADVNPGDGGFLVVPGSHRANHPSYKPGLDSRLVVQPSLKAGDMLIFTEACVHGTRKWCGPNRRRTLLYKYSPGYSSWAKPDWGTKALPLATTDIQRALLQPPFVGTREALPFTSA